MSFLKLIIAPLRKSVLRRSIIVLAFLVPGFIVNYLLFYGGSRILSVESFGIFYTCISIINILHAPAPILSLYFSRNISRMSVTEGHFSAVCLFRSYLKTVAVWGLGSLVLFICIAALTIIILGRGAIYAAIVLILVVFLNYLAETTRSALQGLQRFIWFGAVGLIWMVVKGALGLSGLSLSGQVWVGLLGVGVGAIPAAIIAYWVSNADVAGRGKVSSTQLKGQSQGKIVIFMVSFGLFAVISYVDVFMAYLFLNSKELGMYSASSILPKSILLLVMPVIQILFPTIVSNQVNQTNAYKFLLKGAGITLLITLISGIAITSFESVFCGGSFGIRSCNSVVLIHLVLSMIPICLLRVLIVRQLSLGRDRHPLILFIPLIVFIVYGSVMTLNMYGLSETYHAFAWITLFSYALACFGKISKKLMRD